MTSQYSATPAAEYMNSLDVGSPFYRHLMFALLGDEQFYTPVYEQSPFRQVLTAYGDFTGDYTSWGTQSIGPAISFDGTGDYFSLGHMGHLGLTNFTIMAWVNVNASQPSTGRIVSRRPVSATNNKANYIFAINSSGCISCNLVSSGGTSVPVNDTTDLRGIGWKHVAATYDMSYHRLFVDGVNVQSAAGTVTPNVSDSMTLNIGSGRNQFAAETLDYWGELSDVLIFDMAFPPPVIAKFFAAYNPLIKQPDPLMAMAGYCMGGTYHYRQQVAHF